MRAHALRLALMVLVTLLGYASAPANDFIWDDHRTIENGRLIGSLRNLPRLFAHDTMYNSDGGRYGRTAPVDTYRPLTMSTLFIEHALFGLHPAGYHVMNVLFHLINVLLVFAVGRRLGLSEGAALFAALLFAVHPAISEAVHWINGRSDPLCVLFFLLSLRLWLDVVHGWTPGTSPARPRFLLIALLFLCATLCKETAYLLVPSLCLLLPQLGLRGRRAVLALSPFILGGALGLCARLLALGRPAAGTGGHHLGYALVRLPVILCDGLHSLLLPAPQVQPSLFEAYRVVSPGRIALCTGVLGLGLGVAAWAFRRGHGLLAAWSCAYVLTMAPVAMISFLDGWSGWGRYLYPSAPLLMLTLSAALHDGLLRRGRPSLRRLWAVASTVVIGLLCLQTFVAGRIWRSDRTVAINQIFDHPEISVGYSNLGMLELNRGHLQDGLRLIDDALSLAPDNVIHRSRRAEALMRLGRTAEAFAAAEETLKIDPGDNNARFIHGVALLGKEPAQAARLFLDVLAEEPGQEGIWDTVRRNITALGPESEFVKALRDLSGRRSYAHIAPRVRELLR